MKNNKLFSKGSIITIILGILFVLSGIILPSLIFKGQGEGFICDINRDLDKIEYEVTLYSSKPINTNEVYLKIAGKGYKLNFEDSDYNEYEFEVTISSEFLTQSYSSMTIEAQTVSGQKLEFDVLGGAGKILTTVVLIGIGALLCLIPFIIFAVNIVKQKLAKKTIKTNENLDETKFSSINEEKQSSIEKVSQCSYCGYVYDEKTAKCAHCGAPIKK